MSIETNLMFATRKKMLWYNNYEIKNIFIDIINYKIKVKMLMHKYSYAYLGQLELSSGAFILLVDVTKPWMKVTCDKFNMIWKATYVLIKGPNNRSW